jgi:CheY-like chemotaxis protein
MEPRSLLLVDDDHDTTSILSELLELKGYNVDVSRNGINALVKIKKKKYTAIILDYFMPYLKGDEVAKQIKEIDPTIGLLLITGYKEKLDNEILNDFDFILEKPVDPNQVFQALREVISNQNNTQIKKPNLLFEKETLGVVTIVEGNIPTERASEFEAIYEKMKRGLKPEGLEDSYLLRKKGSNNLYQIVNNWNSQESVEKMRSKGPPADIVAFKHVGVEPTLSMFDILHSRALSHPPRIA